MNPNKPAITSADQVARAVMIARTLGMACASGYMRRTLARVDQLTALQAIKREHGTYYAGQIMCALGWTIEAALLTLCGAQSLERHFDRITVC